MARRGRRLLAAARTDSELCHRLEPVTRRFMHALREPFAELPGFKKLPRQSFELWLPLLVHLFDGEAISSVVLPNPEAEDRLLAFVTTLMIASAKGKTLPYRSEGEELVTGVTIRAPRRPFLPG